MLHELQDGTTVEIQDGLVIIKAARQVTTLRASEILQAEYVLGPAGRGGQLVIRMASHPTAVVVTMDQTHGATLRDAIRDAAAGAFQHPADTDTLMIVSEPETLDPNS